VLHRKTKKTGIGDSQAPEGAAVEVVGMAGFMRCQPGWPAAYKGAMWSV
jgi:hypothetical protein